MRFRRVVILAVALLPGVAAAQRERAREWDAGFHLADYSSLSLFGFGGVSLDIQGDPGYGFSGAYNFTDRLALGVDVSWRRADYRASFAPDGPGPTQIVFAKMDSSRLYVKGTFYLLESRVTPFIEAGYGWTQIDSNIADGPAITGCWWDPWWGYVCRNFYSTYTETKATYGASLGLRWDTRTNLAFRASAGALEVDRADGVDNTSVDTVQLELLWRF